MLISSFMNMPWVIMSIYDNNVDLNTMICKVGHWLCFLVEDTGFSKLMGLCLVIALVDLIRTCE